MPPLEFGSVITSTFRWKFLNGFSSPIVKQVAAVAVRHKGAVLDGPGVLVFLRHFPAIEGLAVAERSEAGLNFGRGEPGSRGEKCDGRQSIKKSSFHERAH